MPSSCYQSDAGDEGDQHQPLPEGLAFDELSKGDQLHQPSPEGSESDQLHQPLPEGHWVA